jgi:hypothetical protein
MQESILQDGEHHDFVAAWEQHMVPLPAPDHFYGRRVQLFTGIGRRIHIQPVCCSVAADAGDCQEPYSRAPA